MSNPKRRRMSLQTAVDFFDNDDSDWFDSEDEDDIGQVDYNISKLMDPLTCVQDNYDDNSEW